MAVSKGAEFSEDRVHRFTLWRRWGGESSLVAFIGLNPSTADENIDDPTVRRCINYAKDWGYPGMYMLNLFALRSTDPKLLYEHDDPIGVGNQSVILEVVSKCDKAILCWGNHGALANSGLVLYRAFLDAGLFYKLYHFGFTKKGEPKHPLYLRKDAELIPWGAGERK